MKKILLGIRIVAALVFIISGLSKLFPAEVFELTLINAGVNWGNTVPYLARLIIAVELFLGFALLQKNYLKRLTVPSSLLLLGFFSVHLIYTIISTGNAGNCGCFGELIPMSPLSALIKNIVLIVLLVFYYISYKEEESKRIYIPAVIFVICLFAVDIISPIQELQKDNPVLSNADTLAYSTKDSIQTKELVLTPTHTDTVSVKDRHKLLPKTKSEFSDFHYFTDSVYVDLDKGIKIAALLSLDCEHCMTAAKEIVQLKKEMKLPPVYFLYLGEEDQLQNFYANSGADNIPYKIINARTFFTFIKDAPPRIVLLNNGNIVGDWGESTFSKETLRKTIAKQ